MKVDVKKTISQDVSEEYYKTLEDVFNKADLPKSPKNIREGIFQKVVVVVNDSINNPEKKELFVDNVNKKISNFIYFDKADIYNTDETVSIKITGYMEKFEPIKYLLFVKKTLKEMVYDSHKANIAIENEDKETFFVVHSYSKDFGLSLFSSISKAIDKFDKIKHYIVKQNPIALDCFEISIFGKKKDGS